MARIILVLGALLIPVFGLAYATEWPGYSGMALVEKNIFLAVNDLKSHKSGSRVTILKITAKNGIEHETVTVEGDNWNHPDGKPSDLEACTAIPGRPFEFLLSESGKYKGRFGRIFHIRLNKVAEGKWRLFVLKALQIYDHELDDDQSTYKGDQVEGISCFRDVNNRLILVYAERGGKSKEGKKTARIIWGELDLDKYKFERHGTETLVTGTVLGGRDCSDLFLESENRSQIVWSVATIDEGDIGPFKSVVYRAGDLTMDPGKNRYQFESEPEPLIYWRLDGLKVEALAAPAAVVVKSGFSIGTDDEDFGGIWRPLFELSSHQQGEK